MDSKMIDSQPSIIDVLIDSTSSPEMKKKAKKSSNKPLKAIFEPDPVFPATADPVFVSISKSDKKRKKKKHILEWTNVDFMRFFEKSLNNLGSRVSDYSIQGRENFNRIHDALVVHFKHRMTNEILKDYLDWFICNKAPLIREESISTYNLLYERNINEFVNYYSATHIPETVVAIAKPKSAPVAVDYTQTYLTGGLQSLLMSGGIVIANRVLQEHKVSGRFGKISAEISKMPRTAVISIINKTVSMAPYTEKDKCDFLSLSKGALDYYAIKEFKTMRYEDYFRG